MSSYQSDLEQPDSICILDILTKLYGTDSAGQAIPILMKKDGKTKYLSLMLSHILFDNLEYKVATFTDETENRVLFEADQRHMVRSLVTTSLAHEIQTPLKCIVDFAKSLERSLSSKDTLCKEAQMISLSANLICSEVKMMLDSGMLEQ